MHYRIYAATEVAKDQYFVPVVETLSYEGDRKGLKRACERLAEDIYNGWGQSLYVFAYEGDDSAPVYQVRYSAEKGGTFSVPEIYMSGVL